MSLEYQPNSQVSNEQTLDQIKLAQEKAKVALEAKLRPLEGKEVEYQIYDDTVCFESKFNKYEIKGFPKYYAFLKDVDYLIQYAFERDGDAIVFFDKSARGYGLLASKLLPVVALEKAIREGKDPKDIKIPKILFWDAPRWGKETTDGTAIGRQIEISKANKIVLFDESTAAGSPRSHLWVKSDGLEPYRHQLIQPNGFKGEVNGADNLYADSRSGVASWAHEFNKFFYGKNFYPYLGTAGGLDFTTRKADVPDFENIEYGISSIPPNLRSRIFVNRSTPKEDEAYVKSWNQAFSAKMGFSITIEDLKNHREQIRKEHSKMAWELFQQVILHQDPYHKGGQK